MCSQRWVTVPLVCSRTPSRHPGPTSPAILGDLPFRTFPGRGSHGACPSVSVASGFSRPHPVFKVCLWHVSAVSPLPAASPSVGWIGHGLAFVHPLVGGRGGRFHLSGMGLVLLCAFLCSVWAFSLLGGRGVSLLMVTLSRDPPATGVGASQACRPQLPRPPTLLALPAAREQGVGRESAALSLLWELGRADPGRGEWRG